MTPFFTNSVLKEVFYIHMRLLHKKFIHPSYGTQPGHRHPHPANPVYGLTS